MNVRASFSGLMCCSSPRSRSISTDGRELLCQVDVVIPLGCVSMSVCWGFHLAAFRSARMRSSVSFVLSISTFGSTCSFLLLLVVFRLLHSRVCLRSKERLYREREQPDVVQESAGQRVFLIISWPACPCLGGAGLTWSRPRSVFAGRSGGAGFSGVYGMGSYLVWFIWVVGGF